MKYNIDRFENGEWVIESGKTYRVEAAKAIHNEDWKTAAARGQRGIQPGEQGTLKEMMNNFYGRWAYVKFDDVDFILYCPASSLKVLGEA